MPVNQSTSTTGSVKGEKFVDFSKTSPTTDYGRCESQASSQSSATEICRICHCEGDAETSLIAPCYCAGSLRFVHQVCLQQWIKSSNIRCCELCKFQFIMHTKTKPFMKWEPLEMSGSERRKLLCAVMFHAIALTCVVWSLYVLIERTAIEIKNGLLEWPFWTKIVVVAIGLTGGVVFMYIQCKAYFQICQRWKAFNRVIYVQNAPEKQPISSDMALLASKGGGPTSSESIVKLKDETSIDLKGVRNLHIFFKDENRSEAQEEEETDAGGKPDEGPSWHIRIGKGAESTGSSNDEEDSKEEAKDAGGSVKLQIKKAEIVIQFAQKEVAEGGETPPQDPSVNIKIEDKECDPIVIDLVKKSLPIRFDFDCDSDGAESKLLEPSASEALSSGSGSPLLPHLHQKQ